MGAVQSRPRATDQATIDCQHAEARDLISDEQSQLEDNLAALTHKSKITPEVLQRIDELLENKPAGLQRF